MISDTQGAQRRGAHVAGIRPMSGRPPEELAIIKIA